ncbi:hypothetical protein [Muricoccus radiodurans]|uniref:hypothetical protein n=1 Tax=Muricoccus radiodurans TaxID=2231721 RepID=UPI003CEF50CF
MADEEDDFDTGQLDPTPQGSNAHVLIYQRGDTVVTRYSPNAKKDAHAGVGTMSIGGETFDTFERLDGYVALDPGHYVCKMEYSPKKFWPPKSTSKRKQIRPMNHGKLAGSKDRAAAILIHPGEYPSSFIGCIGVGRREGNRLKRTGESMDTLLRLCGGFKVGRKVHLIVKGNRPATP